MSDQQRALASIRKIKEIRDIPDADNIVCAVVDGWELVTQKSNNFKEGDLVVYFEVDSVLPEIEPFEFLRDRCYVSAERSINGAGFRLKTIKLKGQVSQGLILPLNEWHFADPADMEEGTDLTDFLGVVKYEKPLPANLAGVARGNFPTFIPKTDEPRVQNSGRLLEKTRGHKFEATVKLDGSSCTIYMKDGKFGVCSRNLDLEESESNSFWQVARKYDIEHNMPDNIAIQGELMGIGVQGNREGLKELELYVFNIFDISKQEYFNSSDRLDLVNALGLKHVPVLDNAFSIADLTVKDILNYAEGPSINHPIREGVVFKSTDDPSISFKAISNKFLLKEKD